MKYKPMELKDGRWAVGHKKKNHYCTNRVFATKDEAYRSGKEMQIADLQAKMDKIFIKLEEKYPDKYTHGLSTSEQTTQGDLCC